MKTLSFIKLIGLLLLSIGTAQAQYSKITYIHSDADGTPFAATNEAGELEWQIEHLPFGDEHSNTQTDRKNDISFAGKPYDEEIGLSYFGARWYDPATGRFTGIDPAPVNPNDYRTFNRYAYGFNNPYKYVDPDGRYAEIVFEAASLAVGSNSLINNVRAGNYSAAAVDAGGLVVDVIGVVVPIAPGVAGLGIAASRKASAEAADALAGQAAKRVPDSTVVCRGGACKADSFTNGSGVTTDAAGNLSGVSTGIGDSVASASKNIPHNKIGVTTAGDIREAGGSVVNDRGNHATVSGITAEKAAKLFKNVVKNPNK